MFENQPFWLLLVCDTSLLIDPYYFRSHLLWSPEKKGIINIPLYMLPSDIYLPLYFPHYLLYIARFVFYSTLKTWIYFSCPLYTPSEKTWTSILKNRSELVSSRPRQLLLLFYQCRVSDNFKVSNYFTEKIKILNGYIYIFFYHLMRKIMQIILQ